jgi:hypothetical protein
MTPLPNLAGNQDCDLFVPKELERAGIESLKLPFITKGEVPTRYVGHVNGWKFDRAWCYWIARADNDLLLFKHADPLHEEFGTMVRVDGHCGCPSPREWFNKPWHLGVAHYHIDTQEGLNALVAAIRKQGEEEGR